MAVQASTRFPTGSTRTNPLALASGSRFRLQMLRSAGVEVEVVRPTVDEPAARAQMARENPAITPAEIALCLAGLKALEVSRARPSSLVIGADQVLVLDGVIFTKPPDSEAARRQLVALRGRTHGLPTAVVLARDGQIDWQHVETPLLSMRSFSDSCLASYLAAAGRSVTETVGGYALEGLGGQLFERVEGDYFSVIGLPLLALLAALRRHGIIMT